jgi:hypothetical protein
MFVMACEFSLGQSIRADLTSASNSAGCRCGRGMNSYPVFRDGSVNCVTYARKLSKKFFVLENCPKIFSDARAQASSNRRFTWPLTTANVKAISYDFSVALPAL